MPAQKLGKPARETSARRKVAARRDSAAAVLQAKSSPPAPAEGAAEAVWFVVANGREQGPVTAATIQRYITEGKVTTATKVRRKDMPAPVPASKVPSFFAATGPADQAGAAIDISLDPALAAAPEVEEPAPEPEPPEPPVRWPATAPTASRIVAGLIDLPLLLGPTVVLVGFGVVLDNLAMAVFGALLLPLSAVVSEGAFAATPGKALLGLRLILAEGRRPGLGQGLLRHLDLVVIAAGVVLTHVGWHLVAPLPVPEDGHRLSLGECWNLLPSRNLPWQSPGVAVVAGGVLWRLIAAFTALSGRSLNDRLAGTAVVHRQRRRRDDDDDEADNIARRTVSTRKYTRPTASRRLAATTRVRRPPSTEALSPAPGSVAVVRKATGHQPPLLPLLKPADWPRRDGRCVQRLLDRDQPQVPWVVLGRLHDDGMDYLPSAEGQQAPAVIAGTIVALRARADRPGWQPTELILDRKPVTVLMRSGDDFTASDLLDGQFLRETQAKLGGGPVVIGIPIRGTMLAAAQAHAAALLPLVTEQYQRSRQDGDEVLSPALFLVSDGVLKGVSK
ncbi:hypothetical protein LBMAG53_35870 [Planctomycetota bacterium]|nr:hypothetical protein LBMAG53_35870 [Planctomycetota bacterium]